MYIYTYIYLRCCVLVFFCLLSILFVCSYLLNYYYSHFYMFVLSTSQDDFFYWCTHKYVATQISSLIFGCLVGKQKNVVLNLIILLSFFFFFFFLFSTLNGNRLTSLSVRLHVCVYQWFVIVCVCNCVSHEKTSERKPNVRIIFGRDLIEKKNKYLKVFWNKRIICSLAQMCLLPSSMYHYNLRKSEINIVLETTKR